MSKIKRTAFLENLLETARNIGEKKGVCTAERCCLAIIDGMLGKSTLTAQEEFRGAARVLEQSFPDIEKAKETLSAHVQQENADEREAVAHMLYCLRLSDGRAEKEGRREATAEDLFCVITENPSDTIRALIDEKRGAQEDAMNEEEKRDILKQLAEYIAKQPERQARADKQSDPEPPDGRDREECGEDGAESDADSRGKESDPQKSAPQKKAELEALVDDLKRIRAELKGEIFGQDHAINTFVAGYFQASISSMIDKTRQRPRATFLFAGPPGVGKTFLAKKAAEALGIPFERFDMSEYATHEAATEFCGSDSVYRGSKGGNFTNYVARHPKSLILFDEIEKAHISIIHLFLQILDAGRIRDSNTDEELALKDTIMIFTTNAGRTLYEESGLSDLSGVSRKVILNALRKDVNPTTGQPYFPAAICSRFASGNVVMFNHMGAHNLSVIADKKLKECARNLTDETGIAVEIDDTVSSAILFAEGSAADARTITSRAEMFFNDELYELFRLLASGKKKASVGTVERIRIGVDLSRTCAEVRALYEPTEKRKILLLAGEETAAVCAGANLPFDVIDVRDAQSAVRAVKTHEFALVLLDVEFDVSQAGADSLNLEDADSPARELFRYLREQNVTIPVYIVKSKGSTLTDEESVSFLRQGIRGVLDLAEDSFAGKIADIASALHQQTSMVHLEKQNKLVTFESAQSVSEDGREAMITLYGFKTAVAVESEDAKSILSAVSMPTTRFDDVIGAKDAKRELMDFVGHLRNPKKYMGTGVKTPRGVILYGPPGTGKTMLAKAMAAEAGVTFIAAEGNQFIKKYVGEGPEKVHELFRTARKYAPSILFIDEIDAIAKERRGDDSTGIEATLTAFLTEMDGFASDPKRPIFVLAATNFDVKPGGDKSLDPALMRRFDRRVYVDLPNKEERIQFIRMKIGKTPMFAVTESQIETIAVRSTGMSLAALDSVMELSMRAAIRADSEKVTDDILEEAFETFNGGEKKVWDTEQIERVARHEAGHAILCMDGGETPSYLTIVARGNHGGYMQHAENEGKQIYTKKELLARIRTSLGGRAAEILYYGEQDGLSTGASGDLDNATNLAMHIVCSYGMDASFGLAALGDRGGALSAQIKDAVNAILKEQLSEAIRILAENKDKVDALVAALRRNDSLTASEIKAVLADVGTV